MTWPTHGSLEPDLTTVQAAVRLRTRHPVPAARRLLPGGEYHPWESEHEVVVQENFLDEHDEEWFEPDHPEIRTLVYVVIVSERRQEVERRLAEVDGLRRL